VGGLLAHLLFKVVTTEKQFDINVDKIRLIHGDASGGHYAPEFCRRFDAGSRGEIALLDVPAADRRNRRRCCRAGRRRFAPIHPTPEASAVVSRRGRDRA
jgi:hypothetical protein